MSQWQNTNDTCFIKELLTSFAIPYCLSNVQCLLHACVTQNHIPMIFPAFLPHPLKLIKEKCDRNYLC